MANLKITQLTELTTPVLTDILPIVDNPTGTPITKKVTLLNLLNGWLEFGETITYVSATSFRIPGNYTSYFTKGTKMKCVNVTTKYGYVLSSTYSAPNTTVNLIANDDYSLVSGAITELKISYSNPSDFPGWFNYTPTFTGFLTNPALGTGYAQFCIIGKVCYVRYYFTSNGISNATTLSLTVPIPSIQGFAIVGRIMDNGTWVAGLISMPNSSSTINAWPNPNGGNFTASGNKNINFEAFYSI